MPTADLQSVYFRDVLWGNWFSRQTEDLRLDMVFQSPQDSIQPEFDPKTVLSDIGRISNNDKPFSVSYAQ